RCQRAGKIRALFPVDLSAGEALAIEKHLEADEVAARQRGWRGCGSLFLCRRVLCRLVLCGLPGSGRGNQQNGGDSGAELSGTQPHAGRTCTTHTVDASADDPIRSTHTLEPD